MPTSLSQEGDPELDVAGRLPRFDDDAYEDQHKLVHISERRRLSVDLAVYDQPLRSESSRGQSAKHEEDFISHGRIEEADEVAPDDQERHPIFDVAPSHHSSRLLVAHENGLPTFPEWNMGWRNGYLSADGHAYTQQRPPSGVSGWESETVTGAARGVMGSTSRINMDRGLAGCARCHDHPDTVEDPIADHRRAEEPVQGPKHQEHRLSWQRCRKCFKALCTFSCFSTVACAIFAALVNRSAAENTSSKLRNRWQTYILHGAAVMSALISLWLLFAAICGLSSNSVKGHQSLREADDGAVIPLMDSHSNSTHRKGRRDSGMPVQTVRLVFDTQLLSRHGGAQDEEGFHTMHAYQRGREEKLMQRRRLLLLAAKLRKDLLGFALIAVFHIAGVSIAIFYRPIPKGTTCDATPTWCRVWHSEVAVAIISALAALWLLCFSGLAYRAVRRILSDYLP